MWNAILMQLIIETDLCINLTFARIPSSPQGMKKFFKKKKKEQN